MTLGKVPSLNYIVYRLKDIDRVKIERSGDEQAERRLLYIVLREINKVAFPINGQCFGIRIDACLYI